MQLSVLVEASRAMAATRSRTAKVAALAPVLRAASAEGPRTVELVAAHLSGVLPQGRPGVGWRSLPDAAPATEPTLTLAELDGMVSALVAATGRGSASRRRELLAGLFGRATAGEQTFLRALLTGEVRQGALDGVMQLAVAEAAGVPLDAVRRAAMLAGGLPLVAATAMSGGVEALAAIDLEVLRPVQPMLAGSAPAVAAVFGAGGASGDAAEDAAPGGVMAAAGIAPGVRDLWSVECKYDGIRIQAHRLGDEVRVFTRSLDDITARVPEVVEAVAALPASAVVLDGEAIALRPDGRPEPFQVTGARTASRKDPAELRRTTPLSTVWFDLLHLDGNNLLDHPLAERRELLAGLVPPGDLVPSVQTAEASRAQEFFDEMVASGHEGIVAKRLDGRYAAGRRGGSWVKVKPRHTLDLVVLAVEKGSGRRTGTLSNIHLGARDPEHPGRFVMLGKTFKGMTDEMLAWQTRRFTELATGDDGWTLTLRPEQVVEVAFDGVQTSSQYPGGVALRFARVLRYRDDKRAEDADTLDAVRRLAGLDRP